MSRITLLATLLLAAQSRAATIFLDGPPVIHVGDTVNYQVAIALAPGESISFVTGQFILDGARGLVEDQPVFADRKNSQGFFDAPYLVDYAQLAALEASPSLDWMAYPLTLDGALGSQTNNPAGGPFAFIPFTVTALAPGELRLLPVPADLDIPGGFLGGYSVSDPQVVYGYAGGSPIALSPPADGVWARIEIVPEPAGLALLAFALLLVHQLLPSTSSK